MTGSNIFFLDPGQPSTARVSQLYPHLELYSDGDPQQNTLFVLGREEALSRLSSERDRLLLIDPPADALERFRLDGDVAVLYTVDAVDVGLPQVQTQVGGVAHIRIGDHFLDIYSQRANDIVHFPALGVLCGGEFGSDVLLPRVAAHSDGTVEIETVRLLASLLKRPHFQLYIPRTGTVSEEKVETMKRLAADVAYLNGLRHLIGDGLARGDAVERIETACYEVIPTVRRTPSCIATHDTNVETLIAALDEG